MPGIEYPFVSEIVRSAAPAGSVTLEIGCGPQQYRHVVGGTYVGLDLPTSAYLTAARPTVEATAEALPIRSESVDLIFGVAVFLAIHDVDRALRECHRVLSPGGRLVIFDYQEREGRRLRAADLRHHHAWSRADLTTRLVAAGFDARDVEDLSREAARKRHTSWTRWIVRLARRATRRSTWLILSVHR